jgi:hypothetical protein
MAIDPSTFHRINVVDTCAVWNILSSRRLHAAAKEAQCDFCVTAYVLYECLEKPRTAARDHEEELIQRLRIARYQGAFKEHACSIADLQDLANLESRKSLGKGELSSLAFAMKIGHGFLSDDMKAIRLARAVGHSHTQTTCHLFAWLLFESRLSDGDKATVIAQHKEVKGALEPHLEKAYAMAMDYRLKARPQNACASSDMQPP